MQHTSCTYAAFSAAYVQVVYKCRMSVSYSVYHLHYHPALIWCVCPNCSMQWEQQGRTNVSCTSDIRFQDWQDIRFQFNNVRFFTWDCQTSGMALHVSLLHDQSAWYNVIILKPIALQSTHAVHNFGITQGHTSSVIPPKG